LELSFDFLTAHFLGDVGYAQPENANWECMAAASLVYGELDLVRFVDIEMERLVGELASSDAPFGVVFTRRRFCGEWFGKIFAVHSNIGTGASSVTRCCVINIGNGADLDGYVAAQRLPLVRDVETIICRGGSV
jgi:hypothetical protein